MTGPGGHMRAAPSTAGLLRGIRALFGRYAELTRGKVLAVENPAAFDREMTGLRSASTDADVAGITSALERLADQLVARPAPVGRTSAPTSPAPGPGPSSADAPADYLLAARLRVEALRSPAGRRPAAGRKPGGLAYNRWTGLRFHEAGHAIVAHAKRVRLRAVSVDVFTMSGATRCDLAGAAPEVAAIVRLAGEEAENLAFGFSVGTPSLAFDDVARARQSLAASTMSEHEARAECRRILEERWEQVVAVAAGLGEGRDGATMLSPSWADRP